MQASRVNVIHVVAMRHGLVTAPCMAAASAIGIGAVVRVGRIDCKRVLVIVTVVQRVQVAVMQVISVVLVLDARMATLISVDVIVFAMSLMRHLNSCGINIAAHMQFTPLLTLTQS
jgi:hypothetical protein